MEGGADARLSPIFGEWGRGGIFDYDDLRLTSEMAVDLHAKRKPNHPQLLAGVSIQEAKMQRRQVAGAR